MMICEYPNCRNNVKIIDNKGLSYTYDAKLCLEHFWKLKPYEYRSWKWRFNQF